MQRQDPCRCLSHLPNAKCEDEPLKPDLAARLDGGQQVGDRHLAIAVKLGHVRAPCGKAEDVGGPHDPAKFDKLVDLPRGSKVRTASATRRALDTGDVVAAQLETNHLLRVVSAGLFATPPLVIEPAEGLLPSDLFSLLFI